MDQLPDGPSDQSPVDPLPGEPQIAPLAVGEERLLQTVHRADGHRNDIYLVHRRPSDAPKVGSDPLNFVAIIRFTDADPDDTEPPWAWQRGSTEREIYIRIAEAYCNVPPGPGSSVELDRDVRWFVDRIKEEHGSTPSTAQAIADWIPVYSRACSELVAATNSCIDAADEALSAREKAAERPQHEASVTAFIQFAETAEKRFEPLYRSFESSFSTAREAAVLPAGVELRQAELLLVMQVSDEALNDVSAAKGILGASFGPTPELFFVGVDAAKARIQDPGDGNIYCGD